MSSQILAYKGPGSGPFCYQSLSSQLNDLLDDRVHVVKEINSFDEGWNQPEAVRGIVLGGGNAINMLGANQGKEGSLVRMIKKYNVSYYGGCAGGIAAAEEAYGTVPDRNNPGANRIPLVNSDSGPFGLGIFPGTIVAPLFCNPESGKLSHKDFRVLNIKPAYANDDSLISSAHILSPGYLDVKQIPGVQVLAHFEKVPVFNVSANNRSLKEKTMCESLFYQASENSPRVVLTASHPEIDSRAVRTDLFRTAFSATVEQQEEIANALQVDDIARKKFQRGLFEKAGFTCKPLF